jgi:hypothetical protein
MANKETTMKTEATKTSPLPRWMRLAGGLLLVPALMSLTACVVYTTPAHEAVMMDGGASGVVVTQAPPAAPVEVVTVAPSPGLVWVGGYWGWSGSRYVWVSGGWHHPPRAGAAWVGGSWARRPAGGHVWVSGHWR